jgi:hypothetical protein
MKLLKLIVVVFTTLNITSLNAQSNYSLGVSLSPFSIIGGRVNTKVEKFTNTHFTYGGRIEATLFDGGLDKHLWVNPFVRGYLSSSEATGLYLELGGFYRLRYAKSSDWDETTDYYKSAIGARIATGFQFFVGSQKRIPIDVMLGLNVDQGHKNLPDADDIGGGQAFGVANSLVGPLNVFLFRIQTGISF